MALGNAGRRVLDGSIHRGAVKAPASYHGQSVHSHVTDRIANEVPVAVHSIRVPVFVMVTAPFQASCVGIDVEASAVKPQKRLLQGSITLYI